MRDTGLAGLERDPVKLRRYLLAIAANSSGAVLHKTLYDVASINRLTATGYDSVLELLHLTEQVPAWSTNQLTRVSQTSKRYMVEPALIGVLLNVDRRAVLRNADLTGRLIDTFVMAQIRPELVVADARPWLFTCGTATATTRSTWSSKGPADRSSPSRSSRRRHPISLRRAPLVWLRVWLDDQFTLGVVLHTGPRPFRLADRIVALPICMMWASDRTSSSDSFHAKQAIMQVDRSNGWSSRLVLTGLLLATAWGVRAREGRLRRAGRRSCSGWRTPCGTTSPRRCTP